ncbi:MAG: hypothetical protein ACRDPD_24335 [Streptosporangiaceae bacterium]
MRDSRRRGLAVEVWRLLAGSLHNHLDAVLSAELQGRDGIVVARAALPLRPASRRPATRTSSGAVPPARKPGKPEGLLP